MSTHNHANRHARKAAAEAVRKQFALYPEWLLPKRIPKGNGVVADHCPWKDAAVRDDLERPRKEKTEVEDKPRAWKIPVYSSTRRR